MSDPLQLVWDALATRGCRPHGKQYNFRARCPAHDGDNRSSLHVQEGTDGRAVLYCFAYQCSVEQITDALGLRVADLFRGGHPAGNRHALRPVRRSDFSGVARSVANVLHALERTGEPWQLMVTSNCPACGSPGAWLRAHSRGTVLRNGYIDPTGGVDADCPNECEAHAYVQALLARLNEREERERD